jgi:hypothetical protein
MKRCWQACFITALIVGASAAPAYADLTAVRAEPNLEKRSDLALKNANEALKSARKAYDQVNLDGVKAALEEIRESVDLSSESLKATGKDPRKSSKYFKQAEIATRNLIRDLENFQRSMSYFDRPMVDVPKEHIQRIHDDLLLGLMEGKKP